MPFSIGHPDHEHPFPHPHIGMRKAKSVLAIFVGFCLWQLLRLFIPGLDVHPIFIYIYGMIEIRESSGKTRDYGRMRILATFTAIVLGVPVMLFYDWLKPLLTVPWMRIGVQIAILLLGTLLVLVAAELVKCRVYCGLAASIFMILTISHFEKQMYLYSIMRAFQTIIGVAVAWLINVKLLPYPPTPGSLSYFLLEQKKKRSARREKKTSSAQAEEE